MFYESGPFDQVTDCFGPFRSYLQGGIYLVELNADGYTRFSRMLLRKAAVADMSFAEDVKAKLERIFSSGESDEAQLNDLASSSKDDAASPAAVAGDDGAGTAQSGSGSTEQNSVTPASAGRVLMIHGYSDNGEHLKPWRQALQDAGLTSIPIAIGNYVTLNNEVTIKDLGEAFDRALRLTKWSSGSKDDTWTFDAIVHSTGMLVLRQWLTSDPFPKDDPRSRIRRLKHLVGLAPATFGSPQGKQGRSWMGALVKGNRHWGPDFLNAGDQVLDGLELASRYTWDLTHKDMVCEKPLYDKGSNTPYVAVFIGNTPYDGVAAVANSPGTDGTVRWAGCALDTRKVSVDFRREPQLKDTAGKTVRSCITPWASSRLGAPMIAVEGQNHGSIIQEPNPQIAKLIGEFFRVADETTYETWASDAQTFGAQALAAMNQKSIDRSWTSEQLSGGAGWQQLVVHVIDDHGDGVKDYNLQLFMGHSLDDSNKPGYPSIPLIVDTYSSDNSYRCFYVRLSQDMLDINSPESKYSKLWLELIASSGSKLIEYEAYTDNSGDAHSLTIDHNGGSPVKLDLTGLATEGQKLLYPYTTTLLEIFVEREPWPLGAVTDLFNFLTTE